MSVSLSGGKTPMEGRVYVLINGKRGTICDRSWDNRDAAVVCRMLGYSGDKAEALASDVFGQGAGAVWFENLQCMGNENHLYDCITNPYGWTLYGEECTHANDAGIRCGDVDTEDSTANIKSPLIIQIIPLYGPQSGGTKLAISGEYLESVSKVKIGEKEIEITDRNDNLILCKTSPIDHESSGISLPVSIVYFGVEHAHSSFVFTYKPDPEILKIQPRETVQGGGVTVTVYGTNLDSVSQPTIEISITIDGLLHIFESLCRVTNSSLMLCETPKIGVNLTADKQDKFEFGFGMDGVSKWKNVTKHLPDYGHVFVRPDPEFRQLDADIVMTDRTVLEIKGENVKNVPEVQYSVDIGVGLCEITGLLENALLCRPPRSAPPKSRHDTSLAPTHRRILVSAGKLLTYDVGVLIYDKPAVTLLLIAGSVGAVLLVAVSVTTIVSVILCRRKKKTVGKEAQTEAEGEEETTASNEMRGHQRDRELTSMDGYLTPMPTAQVAPFISDGARATKHQSCVGRIGENYLDAITLSEGEDREGYERCVLRTPSKDRGKHPRDTMNPPDRMQTNEK